MTGDDLTHAVNRTDLPALIAERYPESKAKPGTQDTVFAVWRGNSRTPSFSVYKHEGVWFYSDKASGESGNAFDFLVQICGMEKKEAGDLLKERAGVMTSARSRPSPGPGAVPADKPKPKPFEPKVLSEEAAQAFMERALTEGPHRPKALARRGFREQDLDDFTIVADGDDALIPIFGPDGKLLNVKRRFANPGNMKYRYEHKGQGSPPWVSPNFLEHVPVVIVEGELNGMIAYSVIREAGLNVAVMGVAGAEGRIYHDPLENRRVYVYADADDPGRKARERWVEEAWSADAHTVHRLPALTEGDYCDLAGMKGRAVFAREFRNMISDAEVAYSQEDRRIGAYTLHELRRSAERFASGEVALPTGFRELDAYTGGLPENDLTLVAALPSTGKSAFIHQVILAYLDQLSTRKVLLFTPDASPGAVLRLIATRRSGVPIDSLRRNYFPRHVAEKYPSQEAARKAWWEAFDDALLHTTKRLIMSEKQEIGEVQQEIWQAVENGVGLVAFDYIQMFEDEKRDGTEGQKMVVKKLKTMATSTLKVPMILAAQLAKYKFSAQRKSGIPVASDIDGSGAYYQLGNHVYLLYNQAQYMKSYGMEPETYAGYESTDVGRARVIVSKNKEGESGSFRYLRWQPDIVSFRDF